MFLICLKLVSFFTLIGLSGSLFLKKQKALTVENCGTSIIPPSSNDRIVGGNNAKPGEFPFLVSLRELDDNGFEHVCGASILNENWIVTAAHCIDFPSSPRHYEILVGLHKLSQETAATVKKYKISKIAIHKGYKDDDTYHNDIALLRTAKPIDITGSGGYINGVCLPKTKADPSGFATVIGWGHTREDGYNSDTLKKVTVPIVDREICNEIYDPEETDESFELPESMICAGKKGKDACQNDSGGPLIQTDQNGVYTIIGVVSHGIGCGENPGVYIKVSMYKDWMRKVMS